MTDLKKKEENCFPEGKIVLPDGREVDCYPLAITEQDREGDGSQNTDGDVRKPLDNNAQTKREMEDDEERFVKNAFFFLAHKERILTDSRMFLCQVPIRSGIGITGRGDDIPTLGIYLLWWEKCAGAMRTDKKGRRSLVYRMSGSYLSGANHSEEVYEDGKTKIVALYPFCDHWKSFMCINNTYKVAKQKYQAYTLKQVLDILDLENEGDRNYAQTVNEQCNTYEINVLNERVRQLNAVNETLERRYKELQNALHNERILHYYDGFLALQQRFNTEAERLLQQKRDLKAALHRGDYTIQAYEPRINAINQRIKEAEQELSDYKYRESLEVFPEESLSFWEIELLAKRLKEKQ